MIRKKQQKKEILFSKIILYILYIGSAYPLLLYGADRFVGPGQVSTSHDHMRAMQSQRPGGFKA